MKTTKELVKNMNIRARAIIKAQALGRNRRFTKEQKTRFVEERQQIYYFMKKSGAYEW